MHPPFPLNKLIGLKRCIRDSKGKWLNVNGFVPQTRFWNSEISDFRRQGADTRVDRGGNQTGKTRKLAERELSNHSRFLGSESSEANAGSSVPTLAVASGNSPGPTSPLLLLHLNRVKPSRKKRSIAKRASMSLRACLENVHLWMGSRVHRQRRRSTCAIVQRFPQALNL